jgi:hypothetical protein
MKRAKYGIAGMRSGTMLLKQAEYIWMPYRIRKGTNSSLSKLSQESEVTMSSMNKGPNIPTFHDTCRTVNSLWMHGARNIQLLILWCPKSNIFVISIDSQVEVCFIGEHCGIQDTWTILQQPSLLTRKSVTLFMTLLTCSR